MELKPFRVFRPEDVQRLVKALEAFEVRVYKGWCAQGCACVTPDSIKPSYLLIEGTGAVSIHDPLLSHPSAPHRILLGEVAPLNRNWHLDVRSLYMQRLAKAPEVIVPTPAPTPAPEKEQVWVQAVSTKGIVQGVEVTPEGDVRFRDGSPCKFDATRPSRLWMGKQHAGVSVPDIILCTFVGPPPSPKSRATLKDTKLASGTIRKWAASNLAWSSKRPARPKLTEEQIQYVFSEYALGKNPSAIGQEMHVASTSVSGVLRGFSHPERDGMRAKVLKERKKNKIPDDSISDYMRSRLKSAGYNV